MHVHAPIDRRGHAPQLSRRIWFPLVFAALALAGACSDDSSPGSPTSASATIRSIALASTPASLPTQGGDVEITATVTSVSGAGMANQQVTFTTTKGILTPSGPVATDGGGNARVRLSTTESATVRATSGGVTSSDLNVSLKSPVNIVTRLDPAEPVAGQEATATVSATRAGADVSGKLQLTLGNGDSVDGGDINGTKSVKITYKAAGDFNLSVTVEEGDGSRTRDTIRVTVRQGGRSGGGGSGGDDIDASQVRWFADCDISDWPIEERVLSVDIGSNQICVDYSGRGTKGTFDIGIPVDATLWVFAEFNGVWYGATWDHLRPGTFCKAESARSLGSEQIMRAPMDASWVPRSGDRVGFMVSGGFVRRECRPEQVWRTNIALITWP